MNLILIADDEAPIREILSRWLTGEGYEVREAESAEAALELMASLCADVVMCDIQMPGQGGVWLSEQLRECHPTTAMILATALDSVPPVTSLKAGIIEYLVKPFERDRVLRAVAAAVVWHGHAVERARQPAPDRGSNHDLAR
jgi:DNA-binding NtrC family response regulator